MQFAHSVLPTRGFLKVGSRMQTVALLCTSQSNDSLKMQCLYSKSGSRKRPKLLFDLKLRNSLILLKHEEAVTLTFDLKPKYERYGV